MNYNQRQQELIAQFKFGTDVSLENSNVNIQFFKFKSMPDIVQTENSIMYSDDRTINENIEFEYPVFLPRGMKKAENAILLMHGLNERSWNKYLSWAEFLCNKTGKPVILFPIAFHMNRSPETWTNPRDLKTIMDLRKQQNGEDRSLSFANVILSQRISEKPLRFYKSGRQSVLDLIQLSTEIKHGEHPLFKENTQIDIFAYSIGAFLSQVITMANPNNLFTDSRLFLFCGGGIFSSMIGVSRLIMDKMAFKNLYAYYLNEFVKETDLVGKKDKLYTAFNSMISTDRDQIQRESFFSNMGSKLQGISLLNDKVMPYNGIPDALGLNCAGNRFQLTDFPFQYTHENPFPIAAKELANSVNESFTNVFSKAAKFLA